VSTEALLTVSGNIVVELHGSCSLRAREMGGSGTKASSVAGSETDSSEFLSIVTPATSENANWSISEGSEPE